MKRISSYTKHLKNSIPTLGLVLIFSIYSMTFSLTANAKPNSGNQPPEINAGEDQTVNRPATVNLFAVANDPDGKILGYRWRQISGTKVHLTDYRSALTSFSIDQSISLQTLSFRVTVKDNSGALRSDYVDIIIEDNTVNNPPIVDAGLDQSAKRPTEVVLTGSASDSDGQVVSYQWTQESGTSVNLNGDNSESVSFSVDNNFPQETLTFKLTATDDKGATSDDIVSVTITSENQAPIISGDYPTSATVNNQYDYTPNAEDSDGDTLTFSIQNKPSWATFESSTGRLHGSPGQVNLGDYSGILISVTDGEFTDELPAFDISVIEQPANDCSSTNIHCVDSVSGETQEFTSVQDALSITQPGDSILVYQGVYDGFTINKSGTSSAPITIKAVGSVQLVGNAPGYNNVVRFQNVSYVTLDGFTIIRDGSANPYDYNYAGIAARGANASSPMRGLQLKNNEVAGCSPAGIYFSQTEGLLLENNYVHDNVRDTSNGRGMGIYLSNASTDNVTARNNVITDNANAGIHMNGDSSVGGDGVQTGHYFENNKIIGNGQNGINMDGIQDSVFVNNVFADNSNHGLRNFEIDASSGPKNIVVINNTFYSNGGSAAKFSSDQGGHILFNNLLVSNNTNRFYIDETSPSTSNNIFSNDSSIMLAPSQRDYRLREGSSAVNAGTTSFDGQIAPSQDLNGYQRDGSPDVGTFELGSN